MKRLVTALLFVCLTIGTSISANAAIWFDLDGMGGDGRLIEISGFDWAPGHALIQDAITPEAAAGNDVVDAQLNMQAHTNSITLSDGTQYALDSYELTAVAGFYERTQFTGTTATSSLLSGGDNYFSVFLNSDMDAVSNENYNSGTQLISGTISEVNSSSYTTYGNIPTDLDKHMNNDFGGIGTIAGIGSSIATITLDYLDPAYFVLDAATQAALDSGALYFVLDYITVQSLPFTALNPPRELDLPDGSSVPVDYDSLAGGGKYDHIVGLPNADGTKGDFIFQLDANSSFSTVPEPSTILLSGLGLLALGLYYRRRSNA